MGEDSPGPPLRRRVPGASGSGPSQPPRRVLPDGLIARMRAAVDAAHADQAPTGALVVEPEPVTDPRPSRAMYLDGERRDTDALDDLAEAYLAADPDLTAGYTDDSWTEEVAPAAGWGALRRTEPGTGVRAARAGWWERAVGSGHSAGAVSPEGAVAAERPREPRRTPGPAGNASKPFRAATPPRETGFERSPKSGSPVNPERAVRPGRPVASDYSTGPIPAVSPERAVRPDRPLASDYSTGPIPAISPERTITPAPIAPPDRAMPPHRTGGSSAPAHPAASVSENPEHAAAAPARDLASRLAGLAEQEPPVAPRPALWADWGFTRDESAPATSRPGVGARRSRYARAVALTTLVALLIAAGIAALVLLSRHDHRAARTAGHLTAQSQAASDTAADLRDEAATWVVAQVSHEVRVSCDPVMCQVLAQQGFPSRSLYQVTRTSGRPLGSAVVVQTPVLRRQFGPSFGADWAPTVLAGFGRGASRITVRVVAPKGASAYEAALRTDLKQRMAAGSGLATSSRITIVRVARQAMARGLVDSRLLSVITALAGQAPIDILEFGRNYPGTSAGTPFRLVVLAETDQAAGMSSSQYVHSMIDLLRAQPAEFRPALITTVPLPSGARGLEVLFAAPSPIGLLDPNR